jgi:hypothetical protein
VYGVGDRRIEGDAESAGGEVGDLHGVVAAVVPGMIAR